MRPNKYAKAEMPKLKVVKKNTSPMNRKERRKILFGLCPCQSGKVFKNCCLQKELERRKRLTGGSK